MLGEICLGSGQDGDFGETIAGEVHTPQLYQEKEGDRWNTKLISCSLQIMVPFLHLQQPDHPPPSRGLKDFGPRLVCPSRDHTPRAQSAFLLGAPGPHLLLVLLGERHAKGDMWVSVHLTPATTLRRPMWNYVSQNHAGWPPWRLSTTAQLTAWTWCIRNSSDGECTGRSILEDSRVLEVKQRSLGWRQ